MTNKEHLEDIIENLSKILENGNENDFMWLSSELDCCIKKYNKSINKCIECYGKLGRFDGDEGQYISCLYCKEGRDRYSKDQEIITKSQEICNNKLYKLREQLNAKM